MTELRGSEKQIKWAMDIRANMIKCLEITAKITEEILPDAKNTETGKKYLSWLGEMKNKLEDKTDASWFIEKRRILVKAADSNEGEALEIVAAILAKELNMEDGKMIMAYRMLREKSIYISKYQEMWMEAR